MLVLTQSETDNELIIAVRGRVGGEGSIDFYKKAKEMIDNDNHKDLVIDFKEMDFIDSSGMGTLVAINSLLLRKGKTLYIRNVPENLTQLLNITGLNKVLKFK